MEYNILKPNQSILKAYLRESVSKESITAFREAMQQLLQQINPSESEEHNKNLVTKFFSRTFYDEQQYMVNTYRKTDLAIYTKALRPVVLFEFKCPNHPDMVTKNNLKHKSLYQLILYYIREEIGQKNHNIKHLVITNCWEYFIFEKKDFYQWFGSNKRFVQDVLDADTGDDKNDYIYKKIIKPEVERIEHKLRFTYLDIRDFARAINKEKIFENRKFLAAYKLFSPTHLLKQPFKSDHNTLNSNFYHELLYIMGVEEVVEDNVHKIKRLENNRQTYSLVEQAYTKIETLYYSKVTDESSRFEIALGLVLTWINRILFLKLLESQLECFNNDKDVRFLGKEHIQDYDVLNDLFFEVLAKPVGSRSSEITSQFPDIPYLNSSLFEPSQLEQDYFCVSGIRLDEMEVFAKTVLKDGHGKRITGKKKTLEYLFEFLDAYDFGSEHNASADLVRQDSKTLINASVLGLIFEKINGYKDGSFFTPGYITQYICQETIRKVVIDKFNNAKGWECSDFEELKERIDYTNKDIRTEANDIVNSLKICDPAVGSGHFLVSALNEIIAIKYDLGILQDRQKQKRIREYEIRVEEDELVIFDTEGTNFIYNYKDVSSQRIQETLFEEKRTIIENCLFGVDLNPKSVEICRLRLWIELLKNTYYYKDEATGNLQLQTLPNIDINIKTGDSLLNRYDLEGSISYKLHAIKLSIAEYKQTVAKYKHTHSKDEKRSLEVAIDKIKTTLKKETPDKYSHIFQDLNAVKRELSLLQERGFFDAELTVKQLAAKDKKKQKLIANIEKLQIEVDEITSNKRYLSAFEWRMEFPEVLDDDGNFIGFDCIIGNPPFIQLQGNGGRLANLYENCKYTTFARKGDIYSLFYERGWQLLKPNGYLCFITSNKWMRAEYGEKTRSFFATKTNPELLIDFAGIKIFDSATVESNILRFSKSVNKRETICVVANKDQKDSITNLDDFVQRQYTMCDFNTFDSWVILSPIEQSIKRKIEAVGKPLKDWDIQINYGIKTGYNEAFIISTEKRNEILSNCQSEDERTRTEELIRPILRGRDIKRYSYDWADLWLIATFPSRHYDIDNYPAVKQYLLSFGIEKLEQTGKTHIVNGKKITARKKTTNKWFETQDTISFWKDYSKPKILWKRIGSILRFSYDDGDIMGLDSTCIATGKHIKYLCCVLNSEMGHYLLKDSPKTGTGDLLVSVQAIEPLLIPYDENAELRLNELLDKMIMNPNIQTEQEINHIVYSLYGLTYDEIKVINLIQQ